MTSITPELYEFIVKVVDDKVKEIRVTREEFDKLTTAVNKLAEAQHRTEQRLERLEVTVERLAEAQRETAKALSGLASQVGDLSDTVGFRLEDVARVMVPGWLERHMKIVVRREFEPAYVRCDGREVQVSLFGKGCKPDGKEVIVVGECESTIRSEEVKSFADVLETVKDAFEGREILAFMFGYIIHPSGDVEAMRYNIVVLAPYRR
ncbi:MAG: hypothetical protein Q6366_011360 [Candidatus Freyarchaeota archaeon]